MRVPKNTPRIMKDIKYIKNPDIYKLSKHNISHFNRNVLINPIYIKNVAKEYPEYYTHYQKRKRNIILYNYVSDYFISKYIVLYNILSANEYNNIQIYSHQTAFLEAILYRNIGTSKNISIIKLDNDSKYDDNLIKLQNIYGNVFNKNNRDSADLFMFNPDLFDDTTVKEYEHFKYTILCLNKLNTGGIYVFRWSYESFDYLKQVLTVLNKYFNKLSILLDETNTLFCELYIVCNNYHTKIDSNDNNILSSVLDNWNKMYPNERNINILKFDKEDEEVNNIVNDIKEISNKFKENKGQLPNITERDLIKVFDENYMNNLTYSIDLCKKYNLPTNPKYEKKVLSYEQQMIHDTITMPESVIVQLFDYDDVCKMDIKSITNIYFKNNKEKENKTILKIGDKTISTKQTEHFAVVNNSDEVCDKFSFNPKKYNYTDNIYNFNDHGFKDMNRMLDMYKLNIDTDDPKKWSIVAHTINIPRSIIYYVKNEFEMNVSRGFVKMFELCSEFNLINFNMDKVTTFHICEAPGHFINAINYHIKLNKPTMEHNWFGNSLNPNSKINKEKYGRLIFGDNYGYIKKYKDRWLFGKKDTGDITDKDNILYYKEKLGGKVELFTSDCGIGVSSKEAYYSQEIDMAKINYCQILIALLTTKINGHIALKMFIPFTESITISLIFLVFKHFESVYFVKQTSGGNLNSEVYLIGKNKKSDLSEEMEKYLLDCLEKFDPKYALFPKSVYNKFYIIQMEKVMKKFVDKQIKGITRSLYYLNYPDILEEHKFIINSAKKAYAKNWIKNVKFGLVPKEYRL